MQTYYAAHYNTILGLLAALQADGNDASLWPIPSIPALASLLNFELHKISSSFYVRAVYQNGPDEEYGAIDLPCNSSSATAAVGSGACDLTAFVSRYMPQAFKTSGEWCDACANTEVLACSVKRLSKLDDELGTNKLEDRGLIGMITAVVLLPLLLLGALAVACVRIRGRQSCAESDDKSSPIKSV